MRGRNIVLNVLKCVFPYTIPIFAGFWFWGLAYGIYMNVSGFSFVYPMVMSLLVFAGSVELVVVYCLRDVSVFGGNHSLAELIAAAVVVGLYLWKKQMLLSLTGGTVCYMLLVQMVFK